MLQTSNYIPRGSVDDELTDEGLKAKPNKILNRGRRKWLLQLF
jgi:hypothetical protein